MIDTHFVQAILKAIGDGQYVGTRVHDVIGRVIGDFDNASENEQEKFVYHMDELFKANLFRAKDLGRQYGWGFRKALGGDYTSTNAQLVLTPIGGEALEELQKPKGLERFKVAIRTAGVTAGHEVIKFALSELFKSAAT